jgi:hypothetical protein
MSCQIGENDGTAKGTLGAVAAATTERATSDMVNLFEGLTKEPQGRGGAIRR